MSRPTALVTALFVALALPVVIAAPAPASADAVKDCPIPELGAIPGHESVFYQCADQVADSGHGCGETGYLLGYGTKYSQRFFHDARPDMSERGQRWIDEVLVCLQHDLRAAIDVSTSCDDIWEIAFDSHPSCYLDAGFCTLAPYDVLKVVWTVEVGDWLSDDAARQVIDTALGCGREYSRLLRFFFWYLM